MDENQKNENQIGSAPFFVQAKHQKSISSSFFAPQAHGHTFYAR